MLLTVQGVRVTAIISAYNEADIIAQTVADLVGQGIAAHHVIDDHSTDGTVAALPPAGSPGLARCRDAAPAPGAARERRRVSLGRGAGPQGTTGGRTRGRLVHPPRRRQFRESPWGHLNLRQGIARVDRLGYNAMDFEVLNFGPTHDRSPCLRRPRMRSVTTRSAAFDRLQMKCWKKTARIDLVSSGGHDAAFADRRVFPIRFLVRHYPIRGQDHGTRKVFTELARFPADERQRGWHIQSDGVRAGDDGSCGSRASLERYDPDVVRARLQLEHRGVEEQAARLAAVGDLLAGAREEQAAAVRALRDEHATEVRRLTTEVAQQNAEIKRELSAEYHAVEAKFRGLEEESRALERMSRDLERQLADMKQSWSWKLTAPLRTAWRRPTP